MLAIRANVSECGGPAYQHGMAGRQHLFCSSPALQFTGSTALEISLPLSPDADVLCSITTKNSDEATVEPSQVKFDMFARAGTVEVVSVIGVKDAIHPEGTSKCLLTVLCQSADPRFDIATRDILVHVIDVPFPVITEAYPAVSSFIGQQITLKGVRFGKNPKITVGTVEVTSPPKARVGLEQ